ncbi:nucleotide exchange factor GrpE, partial [Gordonibacter pamelaeae]
SDADRIVAEAEAALEGEPVEAKPTDSEQVAAAKAEAQEWQDKFLRLHAEWDTYRRRTAEQREAEKARATEKLVSGLLPVLDDFERTIDYATKNGEQGLLDGVSAVHTKMVDVLKKDGVEVIDPQGEAFDALEAQAVATVDDANVPDETVAEVYQKGYKMGSKVLRPAMVTVTSGGPKREKAPDEGDKDKK